MIAARVMAGKTLKEIGFTKEIIPNFYSVKEAVFPFAKFLVWTRSWAQR